jgi:hypothetical protein
MRAKEGPEGKLETKGKEGRMERKVTSDRKETRAFLEPLEKLVSFFLKKWFHSLFLESKTSGFILNCRT